MAKKSKQQFLQSDEAAWMTWKEFRHQQMRENKRARSLNRAEKQRKPAKAESWVEVEAQSSTGDSFLDYAFKLVFG
jgi:hypothetical protein